MLRLIWISPCSENTRYMAKEASIIQNLRARRAYSFNRSSNPSIFRNQINNRGSRGMYPMQRPLQQMSRTQRVKAILWCGTWWINQVLQLDHRPQTFTIIRSRTNIWCTHRLPKEHQCLIALWNLNRIWQGCLKRDSHAIASCLSPAWATVAVMPTLIFNKRSNRVLWQTQSRPNTWILPTPFNRKERSRPLKVFKLWPISTRRVRPRNHRLPQRTVEISEWVSRKRTRIPLYQLAACNINEVIHSIVICLCNRAVTSIQIKGKMPSLDRNLQSNRKSMFRLKIIISIAKRRNQQQINVQKI